MREMAGETSLLRQRQIFLGTLHLEKKENNRKSPQLENKIKASEMLVAPRIVFNGLCLYLPWSDLVYLGLFQCTIALKPIIRTDGIGLEIFEC